MPFELHTAEGYRPVKLDNPAIKLAKVNQELKGSGSIDNRMRDLIWALPKPIEGVDIDFKKDPMCEWGIRYPVFIQRAKALLSKCQEQAKLVESDELNGFITRFTEDIQSLETYYQDRTKIEAEQARLEREVKHDPKPGLVFQLEKTYTDALKEIANELRRPITIKDRLGERLDDKNKLYNEYQPLIYLCEVPGKEKANFDIIWDPVRRSLHPLQNPRQELVKEKIVQIKAIKAAHEANLALVANAQNEDLYALPVAPEPVPVPKPVRAPVDIDHLNGDEDFAAADAATKTAAMQAKNEFYLAQVQTQLKRILEVNTFNNSKKVGRIQDALARLNLIKDAQDITRDLELNDALASHRIGFFGNARAYTNVQEALNDYVPPAPR